MTGQTRLSAVVLAVGLVLGCESAFSDEYVSESFTVKSALPYPLCEGNFAHYESMIDSAEDQFEVELNFRPQVYVYDSEAWESSGRKKCRSGDTVNGCYLYNRGVIHTTPGALGHELIHAVVNSPEAGVFFNEGVAEVYAGRLSRFGDYAPSDYAAVEATGSVNVGVATHFVRWLIETRGAHRMSQLLRSGDKGAFEAFADVYEQTVGSIEEAYFEDAPAGYGQLGGCEYDELPVEGMGQGWYAQLDFDCRSPDSLSGPRGLIRYQTLVIQDAGVYSIATDADWLELSLCRAGRIESIPPDEELLSKDVPPNYAGYTIGAWRHLEGPSISTVELEGGRYTLGVGVGSYDGGDAAVQIWSALGPRPASP